jgi:ketosteroid isomerase-like protein
MLSRNKYLISLSLFVSVFLVAGSCRDNQKNDEAYILDCEAKWAESVATNDASILEKILSDDFIWILDGKRLDKKQAIADAKSGPGDFVSDHLNKSEVVFYGDAAVAHGIETWTRKRKDNSQFQGQFIWTDTWIKRNGNWQIVAAEDISIPISNQ